MNEAYIFWNPEILPGGYSIVIGSGNSSKHRGAILIGHGLVSDEDYQIKIGTKDQCVCFSPSQEEWAKFRDALLAIAGAVQNEPPVNDESGT